MCSYMLFNGKIRLLQEYNTVVCLYFSFCELCSLHSFFLRCDAYIVFMHCGTVFALTNLWSASTR